MSRPFEEASARGGADAGTVYQHPLAYLIGLEGIALLRAFAGDHDAAFTHARLDEVRRLLASESEFGGGVKARPISTREGYARWAEFYDEPGNELLDVEQPIVHELLAGLPAGRALDAACGTGRHAEYLASLGHDVVGCDTSPEMLAVARAKVPDASFYDADLHAVPMADDSVDLVVCAIALTHVPDLSRALRELVRVLRPGGHLVVSDARGILALIGLPLVKPTVDGGFGYMPTFIRPTSEYLEAALALGLQVRRCVEPRRASPLVNDDGTDPYDGAASPPHVPGRPPNVWALHPYATAATNAAYDGAPIVIVWHFQLGGPSVS